MFYKFFNNLIILSFLFLTLFSSFIIPQKDIETIRKNPSEVYTFFKKHKNILQGHLPPVSDEELYIIYCSIVAHSMAPYGPCKIKDLNNIELLLNAPTLHCGNYGFLMMGLAKAGIPDIEDYVKVHSVAWANGPFGAHGTNFIHHTYDNGILLDPTCGLVVFASFNHIAMGKKVTPEKMFDFAFRNEICNLRKNVKNAVLNGKCKPSQIYLYFKSTTLHAEFCGIKPKNYDMIPTPSGQAVLK